MVLNEEQSNLHEGESAAEDGPNLSSILAPSRECPLSEGEYSESMEVVSYLFSADPPADLAEKSSPTPKDGGEADSLSLLLVRLGCIMRCDLCGKDWVRVVALLCASPLF